MRFFYTLRHGSTAGNCGGDLRLFFTTQNSSDWEPSPPAPNPPGRWIHPQNVPEILTLPSGDSLNFSLYPVTNGPPGLLYIFGAIIVTTKKGQVFGGSPIGNAPPHPFLPGQPQIVVLDGQNHADNDNGIKWTIGFRLTVPWDGTSADCTGHWSARWQPA